MRGELPRLLAARTRARCARQGRGGPHQRHDRGLPQARRRVRSRQGHRPSRPVGVPPGVHRPSHRGPPQGRGGQDSPHRHPPREAHRSLGHRAQGERAAHAAGDRRALSDVSHRAQEADPRRGGRHDHRHLRQHALRHGPRGLPPLR